MPIKIEIAHSQLFTQQSLLQHQLPGFLSQIIKSGGTIQAVIQARGPNDMLHRFCVLYYHTEEIGAEIFT